ncbi:hypothetical protein EV191_11657 [Tamaricihabitans halophyticus]|uniref:Uncharacterized protein n=1 Tax=Tamaricihabitans halophyticus TaxID=1262583 RepID=A0A4R2QEM4_9PSEU|nr:hypothetical protein [Tamaricihabitans halophyticus]TCP45415.1 hypothetical protein EV191_11657 [Tamaricihabitans halophyticus]
MLYIVLLLALAALGLLVAAIVLAETLWAWISIGVSVLAAILLLTDLIRQRKKRAERAAAEESAAGAATADANEADSPDAGPEDDGAGSVDEASTEPPAEEATDAADLLIVSELDIEVRVVDEYPRYHLVSCRWLIDRDTISVAIAEARDLGFTPCALCTPDATIATHHREGNGADAAQADTAGRSQES